MMNQEAARILNAVARSAPEYEKLSAEYRPMTDGAAAVPEDLPEQVRSLLRENPEAAARIDRCAENLSAMQSFGVADLLTPEFLVTVLVLLSVYGGIEYKNGKWSFRAGYKPPNGKTMKPVLSVVSAALGKAGKDLTELSKALDGQEAGG